VSEANGSPSKSQRKILLKATHKRARWLLAFSERELPVPET